MREFSRAWLLMAVLLSGCGGKESIRTEQRRQNVETLAAAKFGRGAEILPNSTGTAMLCLKRSKPTQLNPQQQVSFFVYDVASGSILFEDEIPNGSVGWGDDVSVVVTVVPGIVKSDENTTDEHHGYIYDLRLRKTRELGRVLTR